MAPLERSVALLPVGLSDSDFVEATVSGRRCQLWPAPSMARCAVVSREVKVLRKSPNWRSAASSPALAAAALADAAAVRAEAPRTGLNDT